MSAARSATLWQAAHTHTLVRLWRLGCLNLIALSLLQAIFGIISDRFGRKWPLVYNLFLVALFELGTGFVQTFPQFLAVRSLFGIGMGGVWGLAALTALESLPVEVRGLASGILQQGMH